MANEIKIEISAKFEEGGAPSIKSILTQIDKVYKSQTAKLSLLPVLLIL